MDDRITLDDIEHMCEIDNIPILACMINDDLRIICFKNHVSAVQEKIRKFVSPIHIVYYIEVPDTMDNNKRELLEYLVWNHSLNTHEV